MKRLLLPISRLQHVSSRVLIASVLFIGFAGAVSVQLVSGHEQDVQKLNRFVQTARADPSAMKIFREGRDLIEGENWQQAAEKFNGFIADFPKDRDVDAALYWYAYALQKQGLKEEAAVPLLRLVKHFPGSGLPCNRHLTATIARSKFWRCRASSNPMRIALSASSQTCSRITQRVVLV
jgi:tetratricopeptide (TPR) repeat protein